jgi:hypothetical protein
MISPPMKETAWLLVYNRGRRISARQNHECCLKMVILDRAFDILRGRVDRRSRFVALMTMNFSDQSSQKRIRYLRPKKWKRMFREAF